MLKTTTWGDPVRIPLCARQSIRGIAPTALAAARHQAGAMDPVGALPVQLDAGRRLDEASVAELLFSNDPNQQRLALNALNDRMQLFGDLLTGHRTVQLSNTALFPDVKHHGLPTAVMLDDATRQMIDLRWLALYAVQDRRTEPWPGYFKLVNLYHAVTVDEYLPGERIKLGFIEQDETILGHKLYGTGLQWNQLLIGGRWERQSGMGAMLTKWANFLASLAYTTLTASGLSTTAYDTTGSNTIEKDINTINQATLEIRQSLFEATAPKGGQQLEEIVSDDTPHYLLYNSHTAGYEDRIRAALEVRYEISQQGGSVNIKEVNRPVVPLGSPYIPTGNWYVTLPGRLNIVSLFRDLRFFAFTDPRIAGVAEGETGHGAYRVVRGDANQTRKLALS